MRVRPLVVSAAVFGAGLFFGGSAFADSVNVGNLTVAATWRAQPSTITQGGSTTFKLSLKATGDAATSGISFGQSTFSFSSGSADSIPTEAELTLGATPKSAGSSMTAMLKPLSVSYFEDGVYTATMSANDAGISWNQGGVAHSGTYSLDVATTVNVGTGVPTIQSASIPLLIDAGESFDFAALADAGSSTGLRYEWDFDYDGTFAADSTQQNPRFAYTSSGSYTGMLRVVSSTGSTPLAFSVDVLGAVTAMPLPAAVWGGLALVSCVGVFRARKAMRTERANAY
jgi:hypothetical protein